jgi:hypothetical protein
MFMSFLFLFCFWHFYLELVRGLSIRPSGISLQTQRDSFLFSMLKL